MCRNDGQLGVRNLPHTNTSKVLQIWGGRSGLAQSSDFDESWCFRRAVATEPILGGSLDGMVSTDKFGGALSVTNYRESDKSALCASTTFPQLVGANAEIAGDECFTTCHGLRAVAPWQAVSLPCPPFHLRLRLPQKLKYMCVESLVGVCASSVPRGGRRIEGIVGAFLSESPGAKIPMEEHDRDAFGLRGRPGLKGFPSRSWPHWGNGRGQTSRRDLGDGRG